MHNSIVSAAAALNAWGALLNGGTAQVRTGTRPTNCETAATGTLLGTLTLNATAFTTTTTRTLTANAVTQDSGADADGTIGYVRLLSSGAVAHADLTVGVGTGEAQFNSLTATTGLPISFSSMTITMADGS
jgi:hypothetical protein